MKELLKILANRYHNYEDEKNFEKMFICAYDFAEVKDENRYSNYRKLLKITEQENKARRVIRSIIKKLSKRKENKVWCFLSYDEDFVPLPIADFNLQYAFRIWLCKENPKLVFLERWLHYEDWGVYFIIETNINIIEVVKKALIKEKLKMVAD